MAFSTSAAPQTAPLMVAEAMVPTPMTPMLGSVAIVDNTALHKSIRIHTLSIHCTRGARRD